MIMNQSNTSSPHPDLLAYIKSTELFAGLDEAALQDLAPALEHVVLRDGETLFRQDDPSDALYIVMSGCLEVIVAQQDGSQTTVGQIKAGQPVGEMQIMAGGRRTANVRATSDTELVKLPKAAFEDFAKKAPKALLRTAKITRRRLRLLQLTFVLSNLFGPLDETMRQDISSQAKWVHIRRGQALFRQGDPGDSLYLVINGRLHAVVEEQDGAEKIVAELVRGEIIGEMAIFTDKVRTANIYAIHDSVLAKFSLPAVEQIVARYPQVMKHITQVVINRLRQHIRQPSDASATTSIAIIADGPDVPLADFAQRLASALSAIGPTLHLSSERLDRILEMPGMAQTPQDGPHDIRLAVWLDEQETQSRFIIYQSDLSTSAWTRRCIRQADHILLVARSNAGPAPGEIEKRWLNPNRSITTVQQSLVLLHSDGGRAPMGTRHWLEGRQVSRHHHLRWSEDADFARLARFLAGRALGLVLSGGGARGFAHIGVIRALEEAGVPIDMVGGTSMGAIIAAQYAMGWDYETVLQAHREGWARIKLFRAFTLPIVSVANNRTYNFIFKTLFGDTHIENLWVNFFCASANLATAEVVVHRQGPVWKAARASSSLSGIAPPVLSGNDLLIDGGVLDNLPAGVMKTLCGGLVMAVNVSPNKDTDFTLDETYTEVPTPSQVFWSRINPFKKTIVAPNILDIMVRTTLLGSAHRIKQVAASADLYLSPPVGHFGLADYKDIDDIVRVGYEYAREKIDEWLAAH